jgi:hypothetical protein
VLGSATTVSVLRTAFCTVNEILVGVIPQVTNPTHWKEGES